MVNYYLSSAKQMAYNQTYCFEIILNSCNSVKIHILAKQLVDSTGRASGGYKGGNDK